VCYHCPSIIIEFNCGYFCHLLKFLNLFFRHKNPQTRCVVQPGCYDNSLPTKTRVRAPASAPALGSAATFAVRTMTRSQTRRGTNQTSRSEKICTFSRWNIRLIIIYCIRDSPLQTAAHPTLICERYHQFL